MLQSRTIDIDGTFGGAAVRLERGCRFITTDIKLDDLDGSAGRLWPTSSALPAVSTSAAASPRPVRQDL
jgi:hypothetical protein